MASYTAYFNGEWMPVDQVKIDINDRGFTTGDAVFDVARTFNGKTFRLEYHIDRLYRSLKFARMDPALSPEEMLDVSEEIVRRNEDLRAEVGDYYVRQFVTRGVGGRSSNAGPTNGLRQGLPHRPGPVRPGLQRWSARRNHAHPQLPCRLAGLEDQALQQNEL